LLEIRETEVTQVFLDPKERPVKKVSVV